MKQFANLLKILVLLTLSFSAYAVPKSVIVTKVKKPSRPVTNPDVNAKGLKIRPGSPSLEFGDWNSSGMPEFPFEPDYEYSYLCQVQISDSLYRVEKTSEGQRSYRLIAVAETRINNQTPGFSIQDLDWYGKKFYSMQEVIDTEESVDLKAAAGNVGLNIRAGTPDEAVVTLYTRLSQTAHQLVFSQTESVKGTRAHERLVSYVSLDIKREKASSRDFAALNMRVICKKEK